MPEATAEYHRGTIQKYLDQEGYGYVEPDPDQPISGRLLFHRSSLRARATRLRNGERVIYAVRGLEGAPPFDVHPELIEDGQSENRIKARIHRYGAERGFLTTNESQQAFFDINSFVDEAVTPVAGLEITCSLLRRYERHAHCVQRISNSI